jgi:O-antigen ligase
LSWMGMHANELGLLMNMMFALLLFTALGMERGVPRLLLFGVSFLAAITAALTFSRGAFLGLMVVGLYFLLTRRRFGQIAIGVAAVLVLALVLPDAFIERALTGFDRIDVGAITAGRMDGIWMPLWPWVWDSPLIGHGLSSTIWAPANRSGQMLPVGHPHSAYLGVLLDVGLIGLAVIVAFFWSMWRMFGELRRNHDDPFWRGVFEAGTVCLVLLLVQGLTDDRFVPTYPQATLWLIYGLALGHMARGELRRRA